MPKELKQIFETPNVATLLDDNELGLISEQALQGYEGDEESRSGWKAQNKEGMRLAMQIADDKSYPFENASNVMYPLISVAAIQFSARAYPTLIPGWDIVKSRPLGKDPQGEKAARANKGSKQKEMQTALRQKFAERKSDKQ